jgi:hypothetical protein
MPCRVRPGGAFLFKNKFPNDNNQIPDHKFLNSRQSAYRFSKQDNPG